MSGPQWVKVDAHLMSSPLAVRLKHEFGAAGLAVWVAFLCACKRAPVPGQITFNSTIEALYTMGLEGVLLVDNDGKEWDLDSLWRVLGQLKQTRRTARGQLVNVRCTHWGQWQKDIERDNEREKKASQRAKTKRDSVGTAGGHVPKNVPLENEKENEIEKYPPNPPKGGRDASLSNPNVNGHVNDRDVPDPIPLAEAVAALKAKLPEPPVPTGRRPDATRQAETR